MNPNAKKKRALISLVVLAIVSVLAVAGTADAKKHHNKPAKPVTVTSTKATPIPIATEGSFSGTFPYNQNTPFIEGKAQSTITVPKKKNFPIKSVQVAAIVAPSSAAATTIGVDLRLTGPSGASQYLNTPIRSFAGGGDPGSPAGVGYGSGTSCSGTPMKFTNNSQLDPSPENPNPVTDDPGFTEFTSFPPYTAPVFNDLNGLYRGLNSKGTWKLTAFNQSSLAQDTSTLVCWSLTIKPQKLPKGDSA